MSRNVSIFIIACLAAALFLPALINGEVFVSADILKTLYPWKHFAEPGFRPRNPLNADSILSYDAAYNSQIKKLELSGWSPSLLLGTPATASPTVGGGPGRYYPVKMLLHFLLPPHAALNAALMLHVFLMGFFMYLYMEEAGADPKGALFGSVAYMFNGCSMVWLQQESWVFAGAYLPLMLYSMERGLAKNNPAFIPASGAALGMLILSGHPQLTLYCTLMAGAYLLFILFRSGKSQAGPSEYRRIALGFAAFLLIGMLIGCAEILPFLEVFRESGRAGRALSFSEVFDNIGRVPPAYVSTLIYPELFGNPVDNLDAIPKLPSQTYMNFHELCMYMGSAALFAFAGAAAVKGKSGFLKFHLFMSLLLFAMMAGSPAYYPLYKFVPGMSTMNPARLIFLFSFTFAVAAGLGLSHFSGAGVRDKNKIVAVSAATAMTVILTPPLFHASGLIPWLDDPEFSALKSYAIYRPMLIASAACALICLFVFFHGTKKGAAAFALLIALLAYDLLAFAWKYNTTVPPSDIYPETPAISFLGRQPGIFRVMQAGARDQYPNTLAAFGLQEAGGYSNMISGRTAMLLSYIDSGDEIFSKAEAGKAVKKSDRWLMPADVGSPLVDLLNVRYVLLPPGTEISAPESKFREPSSSLVGDRTAQHIENKEGFRTSRNDKIKELNCRVNNTKYRLIYDRDLAIHENTQALPRAFVVYRQTVKKAPAAILVHMSSPAFRMKEEAVVEEDVPGLTYDSGVSYSESAAEITSYSSDEIHVRAAAEAEGLLVLTDAYDKNWKAYVDGRESRIYRADFNFRAVRIPRGRHEVTFIYRPASVRLGLFLTICGIAGAAAASLFIFMRSRRTFSRTVCREASAEGGPP